MRPKGWRKFTGSTPFTPLPAADGTITGNSHRRGDRRRIGGGESRARARGRDTGAGAAPRLSLHRAVRGHLFRNLWSRASARADPREPRFLSFAAGGLRGGAAGERARLPVHGDARTR